MKRLISLILLFIGVQTTDAQDKLTVLKATESFAPRRILYDYLRGQAQKHFDARRKEVAAISTPEELHKRQRTLKAKFIESLGGFPQKTPLNARVVGKEKRDGYHIEKVVYESRPHHHVTATLYLPASKQPCPGVLMPIGHSMTGKAADYVQRGSILLAKNGIAVLAYDPIGQGERRQLLDKEGTPVFRGSTTEHTMIGIGALLVGKNTATYRIWDGIRSLDYLASRAEVDAKRLGCTGCSGGGTLTSYLMALDDRIVAAAPSCYITSLERLFDTIGPQDAEQNITGQVAFGMDHADYVTMRAPRPTLIAAASRDFFDIKGTWMTFREAKLLYGVLGKAEKVSLVEYNTRHGYPKPQREAIVHWMRRWLLNKDDSPAEGEFDIASTKELQCTRSGQVIEDLRGKSAFALNAERAEHLAKQRTKKMLSKQQLLRRVRKLIALPSQIKPAGFQTIGKVERNDTNIKKLIVTTEPGIKVPALHFIPKGQKRETPLVVYLDEQGMKEAAKSDGPIDKLAREGVEVLTLDPRGMGETSPGKFSAKSHYGPNFKETFLSFHLNRPLLGQRVYDVLTTIRSVAGKQRPVHLVAVGMSGPIALHAATFDGRITQVVLSNSIPSWTKIVQTPVSYNQLSSVVPGALIVYDLPDLVRAMAPRKITTR